jgi:hypothetical protein
LSHEYETLRACTDCTGVGLMSGYDLPRTIVNLSVAVPLVLGVFLGATVMAREAEQSTHVLAWTQSVTRRRWLVSKLAAVLLGTLAISAVLSALVTWWSGPLNSLQDFRFDGLQFDIQNLAPIGYSLFAVALGFAAGAVVRRTLPAVALTIAGFVGVRLLVELGLRPRFAAVRHTATSLFAPTPRTSGAWVMASRLVDPGGRIIDGPLRLPATCASAADRAGADRCMSDHGYRIVTTIQPGDRYWRFQWTEFGLFVALAAVLVGVGYLVVLRRDA